MKDIVVVLVTLTTGLFAEVELAAVVSDILAGIEVLDEVAKSEVVVVATESEAAEVEDAVVVDTS